MTTLGDTTVRCPGCGDDLTIHLSTLPATETRDREVIVRIDGAAIARQVDRHLAGAQHAG